MMARPKSTNPRNLTTTMRLTAPESAYLTQRYGSPGKGLRHLLNVEMRKTRESSAPLAPAAPEEEMATAPRGGIKYPSRDGVAISGVWVDEAGKMTMPANADEQVAAQQAFDPVAVADEYEERMAAKVTVEPRKSGKTKKALEAVEAAKAKGLDVHIAGSVPVEDLKGLPDTPTPNPPAKKPAASSDAQKRHLHKVQGDPIRTYAEKGVQWKVYLCECGEELKR